MPFSALAAFSIYPWQFRAGGLMITERGYLEVYSYESWADKVLIALEGEVDRAAHMNSYT